MGLIKRVELDEAARVALEQGHRQGASSAFRRRCQMVLLKSQGRTSREIAGIVGGCEVVVNNWVHRYREHGIEGLQTRPGRGRPAILQESDLEKVRAAVAEHRQRLSVAKAELEQALGKSFGQELLPGDFSALCEKNGGRYKRIRKRPRKEPLPEVYALKVEGLRMLEQMSARGWIDLYYADESRVSLEPCVPYGWQFKEETVFMPSARGAGLNCFALLSRANKCRFQTTRKSIDAGFVVEHLEQLSFGLKRQTVVVLDNAPVHVAKRVQERRRFWQERGLFLFYLPVYSPHLNIVEVLWRKLKYQWLRPQDYLETDALLYQVRQALAAVGTLLQIQFAPFQHRLI